jgi:hypothetical protein
VQIAFQRSYRRLKYRKPLVDNLPAIDYAQQCGELRGA